MSHLPPVPPPPPYGSPYGTPPNGYGPPSGQKPESYLAWAIVATVLCCLPLGIFSILSATKVDTLWASGDAAGAYAASQKAKKLAIWSAAVSVVVVVLWGVLAVVASVAAPQ